MAQNNDSMTTVVLHLPHATRVSREHAALDAAAYAAEQEERAAYLTVVEARGRLDGLNSAANLVYVALQTLEAEPALAERLTAQVREAREALQRVSEIERAATLATDRAREAVYTFLRAHPLDGISLSPRLARAMTSDADTPAECAREA